MFERFSEYARRTLVIAQQEGRDLKHDHIGSEHLLLGLLGLDDCLAKRVLTSLDITRERARQQVISDRGDRDEAVTGHVPFTAEAKKALVFTWEEASALGNDDIRPEHILLALCREDEPLRSVQVLRAVGADPSSIRTAVIEQLPGPSNG